MHQNLPFETRATSLSVQWASKEELDKAKEEAKMWQGRLATEKKSREGEQEDTSPVLYEAGWVYRLPVATPTSSSILMSHVLIEIPDLMLPRSKPNIPVVSPALLLRQYELGYVTNLLIIEKSR